MFTLRSQAQIYLDIITRTMLFMHPVTLSTIAVAPVDMIRMYYVATIKDNKILRSSNL